MQPPMSARITSFASLQLGVVPWFILQPFPEMDDWMTYHIHGLCKFYMFGTQITNPCGRMKKFWTSQLRPSLDSAKGIVARRNLPPSGKKLDISWANHAVICNSHHWKEHGFRSPLAPFGPMILGASTIKHNMVWNLNALCRMPILNVFRWSMAKKIKASHQNIVNP